MKKREFKKQISITSIFIIFVTILLLAYLVLVTLFGEELREYNKKELLKKYEQYEKYFIDSVKELETEEDVLISNEFLNISIEIFKKDIFLPNGVSIIDVNKKDFIKYKNSLNLLDKINLKRIYKNGDSVQFLYKTSHGQGLCIIYTKDKEKYALNNNIIESKKIKNNWYYMELE